MKRIVAAVAAVVLLGIIPSGSWAESVGTQQVIYMEDVVKTKLQLDIQNILQQIDLANNKQAENANSLEDMRSLLKGDLMSLEEARGKLLNDELVEIIKQHIYVMRDVLKKMK